MQQKMCSNQSASLLIKRIVVSPIQTFCRSFNYVHPVTGKKPPTLEEFDPLNPGEWQLGASGKILPRLPERTIRCGKLVTGKYGLSTHQWVRALQKECLVFGLHSPQINYQQKRTHMHAILTKKTVQDRIMLVCHLFDKVDNDKLTLDSDFFTDLGLDSLDFVEVIMTIEDEFGFEIPDGDSDRLRTPRQIYQYICDKCDVYD